MNVQADLNLILAAQSSARTLEECYMEGYHSAQQDMAEDGNPFETGSREHEFWAQGYWACLINEAPLFPEYSMSELENQATVAEQTEFESAKHKRLSMVDYALYSAGSAIAAISAYSLLFIDFAA